MPSPSPRPKRRGGGGDPKGSLILRAPAFSIFAMGMDTALGQALGDVPVSPIPSPELATLYALGILVCLYLFWLVADYRMVPAIRVLCERLHIPDDVAGATVLGAALNAPELFTSIMSTFASDNGVGVSLVMGSFNFNILVITGATALVARKRLRSRQLRVEWLFLQRDVYFYAVSILMILLFCGDGLLQWYECLAMVATYVAYVAVCVLTGRIARCMCPNRPYKPRRRRSALVRAQEGGQYDITLYPNDLDLRRTYSRSDLSAQGTVKDLSGDDYLRLCRPDALESLRVQEAAPREMLLTRSQQISSGGGGTPGVLSVAGETTPLLEASPHTRLTRAFSNPAVARGEAELDLGSVTGRGRLTREEELEAIHAVTRPDLGDKISVDLRLVNCAHDEMSKDEPWATDVLEIAENVELEEEALGYESRHLLRWPSHGSWWKKAAHVACFAPKLLVTVTVPSGERHYAAGIAASVLWLAATSYALSICSSRLGKALGVPDTIVGLTVDSVGTSLPNMLAAVVAGKSGRSETAICQAFGSNTFDALVAFRAVMLAKSCATGFEPIRLAAGGLQREGAIDLALVFAYVWLFYLFRFRLTRSFGGACLAMYAGWLGYQIFLACR